MKTILTLEQFLLEGKNDPGILKAFFMAGGPGSGKSFVATEIFDLPTDGLSQVGYSNGLKLLNSDAHFERLMKDAGIDQTSLRNKGVGSKEWEEIMKIRNKAKSLSEIQFKYWLQGRLGLIIDGTGKNFDKIYKFNKRLTNLGYDTHLVFINTSLEVALQRNASRERRLPDDMVEKMWSQVQENLGKFQQLFKGNLIIVDNSDYEKSARILNKVNRQIHGRLKSAVQNPIGKKWLNS